MRTIKFRKNVMMKKQIGKILPGMKENKDITLIGIIYNVKMTIFWGPFHFKVHNFQISNLKNNLKGFINRFFEKKLQILGITLLLIWLDKWFFMDKKVLISLRINSYYNMDIIN